MILLKMSRVHFKELRSESDFFDVTLACADSEFRTLQAHKLILSACSNFFKGIFRGETNASKHPNPYIFLHGVTYNNLTSILDFIYNGEVNIDDLLAVIGNFSCSGDCDGDIDGNGIVNIDDLLMVISNFGPCE